ncbi:MAG: XdhC family protein [Myxococcales bacterium]|nr:XdhC family protein [Myxococcales bacterium]
MDRWYRTAKELEAKGEGYVLATVIRAVAPTSAKPGDKAVVTEEGVVHGWIGGSCAEPTIKKEAELALLDGACRVVQITPDESLPNDREGLVVVPMTCYSGGELEIYLEPHRAKRELVVFGNSPVAQALVELGVAVGYMITVVDTTERPPLEGATVFTSLDEVALRRPEEAAIVVATHGVFDEDAIAKSVELAPGYLGVVASPKRFSSLQGSMQRRGVSREAWGRVDGPAGIDIGAKTPQEIAVSIIAAITAQRESIAVTTKRPSEAPRQTKEPTGTEGQGHCCHDE